MGGGGGARGVFEGEGCAGGLGAVMCNDRIAAD